jgi:hypothetical protein
MLRNVLIMATSGLVLFSKSYANGISNARLIGSLITAIIEFSQQTTGMGVCFIELSNVSITIVTNESAKVFCALFYDREDGVVFGRLICSEILNSFIHEYSAHLNQLGRNLLDFHGFKSIITSAVKQSTKPVLIRLESQTGINKVLLIHEREITEMSAAKCDQLGVLANIQSVMELCGNAMLAVNDRFYHISMDTKNHYRVMLWKITDKYILLVLVDKTVLSTVYMHHIEEALELVEQVCILHADLLANN